MHEKNENYEVYYLPYKGNLKDQLLVKSGKNRWVFLRKILSFSELVLQNFFVRAIPYSNLYYFSKKLIKTENFQLIISSGKPYILFKICKILNRKFKIPWIADYRDPWSTHPWFVNRGILSVLDRHFEKKWVGSASAITTCSQLWSKEIGSFVKRPAYAVYNGYEEFEEMNITTENDFFTILYNGSLYDDQRIELFAGAFKEFLNDGKTKKVKLYFHGLSIDPTQRERISGLFGTVKEYYEITERIEKSALVPMMKQAQLLLLIGHRNIKGWYPIKVFDYLSVQQPILLCPSDDDVLEKIITETRSGYVLNDKESIVRLLNEMYDKWEKGQPSKLDIEQSKILYYSRENQAKRLAEIVDEILENKV